ncbi:hypothetical protein LMTR13_08650 [Bradyrhizobium icense]|uniref:Uncharacterized protein n=1 Tax=Bradyrhizobium icense TaxID=1274631 RepID=A0A1B1UBT8_9BRAD|nr:hypothetical protein LMTR13_08650 [Bradyrhizobium icense]
MLDLIGQAAQVTGQPIEQLSFCLAGCKIADQSALGGIFSKLFQMSLVVLHGAGSRAGEASSICTSNQPSSFSSRAFFSAPSRLSRFNTMRLVPLRAKMK